MCQIITKNILIMIILLLEIWFGNVNSNTKNIETDIINIHNDNDNDNDNNDDNDGPNDHKVEQELKTTKIEKNNLQRQFNFYHHKETTTDNFIRLLVMRLIYGLAATMGIEERLEGLFNGAFVPPNADNDDYFSLSGFSDYADDGRSKDVLDVDI